MNMLLKFHKLEYCVYVTRVYKHQVQCNTCITHMVLSSFTYIFPMGSHSFCHHPHDLIHLCNISNFLDLSLSLSVSPTHIFFSSAHHDNTTLQPFQWKHFPLLNTLHCLHGFLRRRTRTTQSQLSTKTHLAKRPISHFLTTLNPVQENLSGSLSTKMSCKKLNPFLLLLLS